MLAGNTGEDGEGTLMLTKDQINALQTNDLLSKIAEEASEIIHAAMKYQVHGEAPFFAGVQYNNHDDICTEFLQLEALIEELKTRKEL